MTRKVLLSVLTLLLVLTHVQAQPIQTEVPVRPAGQRDVIGLTVPPMKVVRVGFIGLGMRGPGAVERFSQTVYSDEAARETQAAAYAATHAPGAPRGSPR